jgi:hypothetical protein
MDIITVVDDPLGKIEVYRGFGQTIRATRSDGEIRQRIMIESREEYDYEMIESMRWLGLVDDDGNLTR